MHCRVFSHIPGLYLPVSHTHTHPLGQPEMSPDFAQCSLGTEAPLVENHWHRAMKEEGGKPGHWHVLFKNEK